MNALEFFVSAGMFLTLSAVTLQEVTDLHKHQQEYDLTLEEQQTYHTTQNWIEEFIRGSDTHRFSFGLTVHKNSHLTYSNEDTVILKQASSESDAITLLELDPLSGYRVISGSTSTEELDALACPQYDNAFKITSSDISFIGFSSNCTYELVGKSYQHKGRPECRDFYVKTGPSVSIPACASDEFASIKLLYPLRNHLTLYVSTDGALRLAQHRLQEIIENQPLTEHISRLTFNELSEASGTRLFQANVTLLSGKELKFTTAKSLSPLTRYNLLFHF